MDETNTKDMQALKTIIYKLAMDMELIQREREMIDVIVEKGKYA